MTNTPSLQNSKSSTRSRGAARLHKIARAHRRHGQALLEAAFILPILLLFMLGILQFGLVYNAKLALQHACRGGARYAAAHAREKPTLIAPFYTADDLIKAKVISTAQTMGVPLSANDITVGPALANTSAVVTNRVLYGSITVTITYNMNQRRIIPRQFYLPIGGGDGKMTTVTLPLFNVPYVVSETVIMEGADVP